MVGYIRMRTIAILIPFQLSVILEQIHCPLEPLLSTLLSAVEGDVLLLIQRLVSIGGSLFCSWLWLPFACDLHIIFHLSVTYTSSFICLWLTCIILHLSVTYISSWTVVFYDLHISWTVPFYDLHTSWTVPLYSVSSVLCCASCLEGVNQLLGGEVWATWVTLLMLDHSSANLAGAVMLSRVDIRMLFLSKVYKIQDTRYKNFISVSQIDHRIHIYIYNEC